MAQSSHYPSVPHRSTFHQSVCHQSTRHQSTRHQSIRHQSIRRQSIRRQSIRRLAAVLLTFCLTAPAFTSVAQSCSYFPADCPAQDPSVLGTPDDSLSRMGNPLLPREITMENRLRTLCTRLMQQIAEKEGWDMVELDDAAAAGARDENQNILVYERRPPHWMAFTYQFIVNKDSLRAWSAWITDFAQRRLSETKEYMDKAASKTDQIQACMDSANYYNQLRAKYMTDHIAQYQQAVTSNNKKQIDAWEKVMARYDQQSNVFINKAAALQKDPAAEKSQDGFETEKRNTTLRFRESCVLIVTIGFNGNLALTSGRPSLSITGAKADGIPVRWYERSQPDPYDAVNLFTHSRNMALLLMGSWDSQPDANGTYFASFSHTRANTDKIAVKKIKCDVVQTADICLSGNRTAMHKLIAELPATQLNGTIGHIP